MIIPDQIIRSDRKTLSVTIDRLSRVIVRAPRTCDEKRIFAFLQEKEVWITRKKSQTAGAGMALPPENLDGYTFMLLGKNYRICLYEQETIRIDQVKNTLYVPKKNARTRLVKWLKENALRIFTELTQEKAREMSLKCQSVSITGAKSFWGLCTGKNAIRYTFRLLYAPKEVVEYVIVHELAHIRHKDHSKAFWATVQSRIPDWKKRRQWLKTHGVLMEIF